MLWLGNAETVTPLHYDELENMLVVFRGRKRITLFHPAQTALLYRYADARRQRFCSVNAENPDDTAHPLFAHTMPDSIDLDAGDALVIPLGWWHHVHSYDTCLAVSFMWRCVAGDANGSDGA